MQDKTPTSHDSLSHLPPQGFFDEQEAMAKLVPIADELVALVQKARAPQCLHQIQEPSAAEQAAWHAGLDEGRAQAAQNSAADVPASGAVALSEYLKTCEQHAIVPDVGGAFASAFAAGFNLAASREAPAAVAVPDECAAFEAKFRHLDLSQKPDAWGHARYSHDAISLAWEAWQARAALAATPAAPVAEDVRHRNGVRKLQAASASQARKDGVDAGDALYALAVKHGASKTEAAGFAHHINGAFALLEGQVHDGLSRETARDSATPTAAAPVVLPAGRLSGAEMIEALEWRRQAELEAISASPAAAAPVVLPEPDAVISEVMGLVDEWGMESHLRGEAELDAQHSEATQEEIDCAKDRASKERAAWNAIESKLRALLATATGLPAQAVLDYPWRARLLDGRDLVRDQQGFAEHPELPQLDEGMKPRAFFAALGVEMKHTMADDDLSMDEYDAMSDAENWSAWMPRPPIGDAWNLVAIFDTEDGPAAWWARAQKESQEAEPQAQIDAQDAESDYQRGYRHGYNRRDAEVQGALL